MASWCAAMAGREGEGRDYSTTFINAVCPMMSCAHNSSDTTSVLTQSAFISVEGIGVPPQLLLFPPRHAPIALRGKVSAATAPAVRKVHSGVVVVLRSLIIAGMNAICQADVMDDKGRLQARNLRAPVTPPNTKIYPMSRGRTTEVGGLPFPPYKFPFELLLQKAPLSRLPSNQHWKRRGRAEDGDGRKYEVGKGGRPLHHQSARHST